MSDLTSKKCIPCEDDVKAFTSEEIAKYLPQISSEWKLVENKKLERKFSLANFKKALEFINKVGALAGSEGHHPDIFLHNWNKVDITLSTHAIDGLFENDFILAAKIDELT